MLFLFTCFCPFFSFVCVLLFVAVDVVVVVLIVVMFFLPIIIQVVYRRQGRALVPFVIPAPLCNDFKSCDRNSAKSGINI